MNMTKEDFEQLKSTVKQWLFHTGSLDLTNYANELNLKFIEPREKRIADLERRIERAKECMKKLLFIINSEPSNYNCKGLVQDAEDFIYNRTCNIRKSGNHCITEEPCIMCDN